MPIVPQMPSPLTHLSPSPPSPQVPISLKPSRPGDPPILYSDPSKIKFELGWRPR